MHRDPPSPAGHRRVFLELYVRDDDHGHRRRVDVPLDVPMPPDYTIDRVPTERLLATVQRALGFAPSG